jgi:signal transduction histidine kinase/DNA-binding NarL/FixJ family response regulator
MNFSKVSILFLLLLLNFNSLIAQHKEEEFVKASFLINFIEEIVWPNEGSINEFNIGVLNDPNIYSNLAEISKNIVIRGKVLKIKSYNTISSIKQADLLIVSEKYSRKFSRYDFLGKNCLIVSSNSNDARFNMINFYIENRKVQFELNPDILKVRGYTTSVKLLVFGGESTEVLGAFSEYEELLSKKNKELKKRNEEIKESELKIWKLGQDIATKETDIANGRNEVEDQNSNRSILNKKILDQRKRISEFNEAIKKNEISDEKRHKKRHTEMEIILELIKSQKNDIDENNKVLENQKGKISIQEEQLVKKDSELKKSMIVVVSVTIVLLLFVFLFYLLYRSNKSKKDALKIIEHQNDAIIKGSLHKDEFIANMSHEIRTPLNAIVGFTNLLIATAIIPQNKNYLNKVLLSSNNLLNIINDILDISKIESGKMELELIDFDIKVTIQNVFYSLDIKSKNIDYQLNISDDIPLYLKGDPTKIGQILLNLLNNAVKFTDKGKVRLDVELVNKDENDAVINFKISDTGIGISKKRIDAIFEKFTQEAVSVTRKQGGTGLGLSITKSFVDMMAGTIDAESLEGEGSVFNVILTLPIVEQPEETITESDLILIDGIENIKIIFADDHELNMESMVLQFKEWNNSVQIDEAYDGQNLLEKLEQKDYDVVLTDIRMPKISGIEVTKKIRETDPHIVIIGLSANATTKAIQEGINAGMNDYLTKPIQFNQLLYAIARHINLPCEIVKRNFLKEEKLLSKLEIMSENRNDFLTTVTNLVNEIDSQIELIINGDYSYSTIHSLLNKIIYIGDKQLTEAVKGIQKLSIEEQNSNIEKEIIVVNDYWIILKKKIEVILITN